MKVDLLRDSDVDGALSLSVAEGWNQTRADWTRLERLDPSGCFVARENNRLAATVTTTSYGRELAWIGMMVVSPDLRGRGIGAMLMRTALDHLQSLGVSTIKLDATPAGRPLYESLGFVAEADVERWQGDSRPASTADSPAVTVESLESLRALDRAAYGADRSPLLEQLATECPGGALAVRSAREPEGFALARRGRLATYIGPIVATSAGAAEALLDGMLARFAGAEVCLDLHRLGPLVPGVLVERGLSMRRGLTRMRLGAPSNVVGVATICASAGPELG